MLQNIKRFCIVVLALVLLSNTLAHSQSFRKKKSSFMLMGWGVTGGGTLCTQIWNYAAINHTETKNYRLGWNGSVFVEMMNKTYWRWISELQYNQKGAIDQVPTGEKFNNRIDYISFNNFIKIREEEYAITPYLIAGPRIEYKLSTHPQDKSGNIVNPSIDIINNFKPLHVSFSVGAGVEFLRFKPWLPFIEFQFNPDITNAYRNKDLSDLQIRHRAFELRVGLKYALQRGEKCPPAAH